MLLKFRQSLGILPARLNIVDRTGTHHDEKPGIISEEDFSNLPALLTDETRLNFGQSNLPAQLFGNRQRAIFDNVEIGDLFHGKEMETRWPQGGYYLLQGYRSRKGWIDKQLLSFS